MGVETLAAVGIPLIASFMAQQGNQKGDQAVQQANAQKLALMGQAQGDLSKYRPQLMDAQMKAMDRRLGAYRPAQDALATMYGGGKPPPPIGYLPDPSVLGQNAGSFRGRGAGGIGDVTPAKTNVGRMGSPLGPVPMPSKPSVPQLGNGPPMGTPSRGMPDPREFLMRKPGGPY